MLSRPLRSWPPKVKSVLYQIVGYGSGEIQVSRPMPSFFLLSVVPPISSKKLNYEDMEEELQSRIADPVLMRSSWAIFTGLSNQLVGRFQ
jgi:hypothetical protein